MSISSARGTGASASWLNSGIGASNVSGGPNITASLSGPGNSTSVVSGRLAQAAPASGGLSRHMPDTAMPISGQDGCRAAIASVIAAPIE